MNTADIPRDLKFYIPLLLEVILESPIKRDGSESSYFIYSGECILNKEEGRIHRSNL